MDRGGGGSRSRRFGLASAVFTNQQPSQTLRVEQRCQHNDGRVGNIPYSFPLTPPLMLRGADEYV